MRTFFLLAGVSLLTSCATVTRGTHDKLRVESEPAGADVALSSGERGTTPTVFRKKRTESFLVTVSKPGFQTRSVQVESKFSATGGAAIVGNALIGGIVGGAVDMATGATRSLYPNPLFVTLVPTGRKARTGGTVTPPVAGNLPSRPIESAPRTTRQTEATNRQQPAQQRSRAKPSPFRTDEHGTQYLDTGR